MDKNTLNLIPQREPFVLIDTLLTANDFFAKSKFLIPQSHVLVINGSLSESGLIENMAQTIAAGMGSNQSTENQEISNGYIGALKNLSILQLPKIGETIQTEVIFITKIMNAVVVNAKVFLNELVIAECELKVFIQS